MPEKYCKLDSGEEFLVAAEEVGEGEVVLVFLSDFGARVMSKSPVWVADGTFKCVPPQFGQLYVVHGSKHDSDKLFPACYCLLPNKQSETYLSETITQDKYRLILKLLQLWQFEKLSLTLKSMVATFTGRNVFSKMLETKDAYLSITMMNTFKSDWT